MGVLKWKKMTTALIKKAKSFPVKKFIFINNEIVKFYIFQLDGAGRQLKCTKGLARTDRFKGMLQRSDIVNVLIQQRGRGFLNPTHGNIKIFYGKPGVNNVDDQHLGNPGNHRLLKKCRIPG